MAARPAVSLQKELINTETLLDLFKNIPIADIIEKQTNYTNNKLVIKDREDEIIQDNMDINEILIAQEMANSQRLINLDSTYNMQTPQRPTILDTLYKRYNISPQSQKIIDTLQNDEIKQYILDYIKDNKILKAIEKQQSENDPDFTFKAPSDVGLILEDWTCVNIPCPICNTKLKKYLLPSMPVIDVVCDNPQHTIDMGVKYFQIKATEFNSFNFYTYFTLKPIKDSPNGYIKVGSKRFGLLSHNIKPSEPTINKELLIGYICFVYHYILSDSTSRNISINSTLSFMLLPNINSTINIKNEDYYYKYLDAKYPVITYNDKHVNAILFKNMGLVNKKVNLDTQYQYNKILRIDNNKLKRVSPDMFSPNMSSTMLSPMLSPNMYPPPKRLSLGNNENAEDAAKYKYLKYKNKYILLKNFILQ